MINSINGKFTGAEDGFVHILTPGGVEYEMECSQNTINVLLGLSEEERKHVRILTHFLHSENGMYLYGFMTEEERYCYREITKVNGIGSKVALKVLSSITVKDFISALDRQDVKRLSALPGLGAKTAQKLILQLRNILVLEEEDEEKGDQGRSSRGFEFTDLVDSLVDMGYDKKRVREEVSRLLKTHEMDLFGKSHEAKERFLFSEIIKRR